MTTTDRDARGTSSYSSRLRRYRSGYDFTRAPLFVSVSRPTLSNGVKRSVTGLLGQKGAAFRYGDRVALAERETWRTDWWQAGGKRLFDIAFSVVTLVLLAPALLLIAGLVKVSSPGPILFRQLRHGRNYRLFPIYKFRTMAVSQSEEDVILQTRENDERVSRIGAFLRRTSLDELPQLINVLKGDMSIVGPRPHAPLTAIGDTFFETLASGDEFKGRYTVRPGITGLAQVSGCRGAMWNRETAIKRLECDVRYVREQNFWLDMKIIALTFVKEFLTGKAC